MRVFLCVCVLCLLFCFLVHCLQVGQPNMPPATHLPWKEKSHHPSGIPSLRANGKNWCNDRKTVRPDRVLTWIRRVSALFFCRQHFFRLLPGQFQGARANICRKWHELLRAGTRSKKTTPPKKKHLHGIQCFSFFCRVFKFQGKKRAGKVWNKGERMDEKEPLFFPHRFFLTLPIKKMGNKKRCAKKQWEYFFSGAYKQMHVMP